MYSSSTATTTPANQLAALAAPTTHTEPEKTSVSEECGERNDDGAPNAARRVMKWMVPINQLDATQLRAIDEISSDSYSNHTVSGFAGSEETSA